MAHYWDFIIMGAKMLSMLVVGRNYRIGWLLGVFAMIAWVVYGLATDQMGLALGGVGFMIVYGWNWYKWGTMTDEERAANSH